MFSPTGYYAHYRIEIRIPGQPGRYRDETYPIIGTINGIALIIGHNGKETKVTALLDELNAVDGRAARLHVNAHPEGSE